MPTPDELKMDENERLWWETVRGRGAFWYVATKGLFFLVAFPCLGIYALDWAWEPSLLVEGWFVGLFWGSFFFMRKELRCRFNLEQEGRPIPDGWDE